MTTLDHDEHNDLLAPTIRGNAATRSAHLAIAPASGQFDSTNSGRSLTLSVRVTGDLPSNLHVEVSTGRDVDTADASTSRLNPFAPEAAQSGQDVPLAVYPIDTSAPSRRLRRRRSDTTAASTPGAVSSPSAYPPLRQLGEASTHGVDIATGRRSRRWGWVAAAAGTVVLVGFAASARSQSGSASAAAPASASTAPGVADGGSATATSTTTVCRGLSPASAEGCSADRYPATVIGPIPVDECRHLTDITAGALGVDPDLYNRLALASSARRSRPLNEIVLEDLNDERTLRLVQLQGHIPLSSAGFEAVASIGVLDAAIMGADVTICSAPPPGFPSVARTPGLRR